MEEVYYKAAGLYQNKNRWSFTSKNIQERFDGFPWGSLITPTAQLRF